ncbi:MULTISPECIES: META domain-containing protein [Petrimonas]|jgi:hypothetical protein|uniref:DUF306 domain-containing protein n=1 Tax=Petrimonas mucosa TaxID=1642646 RepID=A0A1G4G5R5_9BACT|nr:MULTISPECIES: META domain-containing protein [Petrimonas]MDD3560285.1 META domain-containing protein [Petrimonas mucosa]SCM56800.1 hypothetical protein ING2E5A_1051 [Petrimonas mucosa]SFU38097.1 META domain-containing protein [Porphyromonadaceae bacterium KHP3R9]HHT30698.1 META domain-containing protein [Petrimonas mucosa]
MSGMRRNTIVMLFGLLMAILSALPGCSRVDELGLESSLYRQSPYGKWKLQGYGSKGSQLKQLALGKNPNAFTLTLHADGTFNGISSVNEIRGTYSCDLKHHNISFSQIDTENNRRASETREGNLYLDRLVKVYKYEYKASADQLYLYYSNTEYLLFLKLPDK